METLFLLPAKNHVKFLTLMKICEFYEIKLFEILKEIA